MFNKETEILFKTAKKMLDEAKNVTNEESKKIDKEWLEKVNTTINSINSNSDDTRTVSEVIVNAKKERSYLLNQLSLYSNNTEKQMNISKRLYDLNAVISSYEDAFSEKENRKFDILKNKQTDIIASMLDELMKKTDKEIFTLKSNIDSNLEELRTLAGQVDFEKVTEKLKNSNEKLVEFNNLKKSLEELKTYNGNISSDKKLNELTNSLEGDFKELVNACYNLIISNNVDLSKKNIKSDDTKTEEIKKLLKKSQDNKDIKLLEEAEKLINELEDSKEKEELSKKASEIRNLMTKDEHFAFALKMVEELEEKDQKADKTGKKEDVLKADDVLDTEDFVNKLENSKNQDKLLKRLSIIKRNIQKRFTDLLGKLEKNIMNNKSNSYENVDKLAFMFNELVGTDNFNKNLYGNRVSNVIREYNAAAQDEYKKTLASTPDREKAYTKGEVILEGFSTLFTKISRSKLARKLRQKLLDKAIEKDDKEKIEKYTTKIHNNDIVNSFKLFTSVNKLNKLKPVLFKDGLSKLSKKMKRRYYTAKDNICYELNNGLIDLTEDENVLKNKERTKTIADQLMNQLSVSDDFEADAKNLNGFLNEAKEKGGISNPNYDAYIDEIRNMKFYNEKNEDSIYEVTLEELENDSTKYFEKPYLYEDEKIVRALPYIKRY